MHLLHLPTQPSMIGQAHIRSHRPAVSTRYWSLRNAFLSCAAFAAVLLPHPIFAAPAGQSVETASSAEMALRYAQADRFAGRSLAEMVDNTTIAPKFVGQGEKAGLLYQTGNWKRASYVFLDLATMQKREIATSASLMAATGRPNETEPDISNVYYDPTSSTIYFQAAGKSWTMAAGEAAKAIPSTAPASMDLPSPDGKTRIVARNFNLYAVDVASGREVALTTDGTREQPYGRPIPHLPDMLRANSEEPDMPVSAIWSPDSRYLLTWRLDVRGVRKLSMTQQNPPGEFYPRSFSYIYPLAGARVLPQSQRLTIDVAAAMKSGQAKIIPLAIPSESILYPSPPDMGWQDGKVRAQWTERGYKQIAVYHADPATGKSTIVAHESVKPLVTVTSSMIMPAPKLGGELSISERTGWAQLYLVHPNDPDGGTPLTKGEWEVLSVDHIADDRKSLLVTGVGREAKRNPYWRSLYRVATNGSSITELTPEPLDHDVSISDDGRWIVDEMSSPTSPTRSVLRDGATGKIIMELAKADMSRLMAAGYTPPEPFKGVAADGKTPIYGMLYRPANFDPKKNYPIIDNVYTGPTTTDVPATWNETIRVSGNSVAQLGAIVVMIDGTGTSRRGQKFRLPAYENLGEVGLDDHISLIRQMAQKYPYMDTQRVGVFGGSAGGYDTARFLLRRPDFFNVGVSSAGNHELRLDKTWWPEVSMGDADDAIWEANSNISVAGNLQGKLLLVHGDIDDNVPITASYRLAKALIDAGRDVDMIVMPNTGHGIYQPFYVRKMRDYFTRHLLGETPPPLPPVKGKAQAATQ
ncbi:MAG: S9 family peptidase [Sphingobium sp.]|nr:S9 family peptidase [Sphingobium sp.]